MRLEKNIEINGYVILAYLKMNKQNNKSEIEKKYKGFVKGFERLCEKYMYENFDVQEVKKICNEIIEIYGD